MDVLGVVEEVTHEGVIIVRGDTTPEHGDPVYDAKQKRIGSVRRIFGPVSGPYISVTPVDRSVLMNITGKKVYTEKGAQHGKNKRRNG
ncbi:MAG: Gar1/Naf1 family protein [Methanomassiliicoccaceae archaeon]|jgi:rRNA processing protein Gar1|nr:Gar1/Naf1 family protein [Methanomassiliicoccaceae archaeon]